VRPSGRAFFRQRILPPAAPSVIIKTSFLPGTSAPLAQLDRASGYEPEGREFESLRAHHLPRKHFRSRSFANERSGFRLRSPGLRVRPASRPQIASSSNLSGRTIFPGSWFSDRDPSRKALRISAAVSRPSRALGLTPANRLKFESLRAHHLPRKHFRSRSFANERSGFRQEALAAPTPPALNEC
jgi:hypothetical protein